MLTKLSMACPHQTFQLLPKPSHSHTLLFGYIILQTLSHTPQLFTQALPSVPLCNLFVILIPNYPSDISSNVITAQNLLLLYTPLSKAHFYGVLI